MLFPSCHRWNQASNSILKSEFLIYKGAVKPPEAPGATSELSLEDVEAQKILLENKIKALAIQYNRAPGHVGNLELYSPISTSFEGEVQTYLRQISDPKAKQFLNEMASSLQTLRKFEAQLAILESQREANAINTIPKEDPRFNPFMIDIEAYNGLRRPGKNELKAILTPSGGLDLKAMLTRIDDILLHQPRVKVNRRERIKLREIEKSLKAAQEQNQAKAASTPVLSNNVSRPDALKQSARLLIDASEIVDDQKERQSTFEQLPVYQEVAAAYDAAIHGKGFENLSRNPNGKLDQRRADDNRRLFLSYLEQETGGFKKDPADILQSDAKQNIQNQPALYEAWFELKAPRLQENILVARDEVERATPPLDVGAYLNQQGIQYSFLSEVPLLRVQPTVQMAQAHLTALENNINLLESQALREKNEKLNEVIQSLKSTYLKYGQLQLELARLIEQKQDIERQFTRENLKTGEGRTLLIKALMRRFQKAVETVDQITGQGQSGDLYHPPIRALLIAEFSRKGVGEKQNIKTAWILEKTKASEAFNTNAKGFRAGPARRAAIELAFVAGQAAQDLFEGRETLSNIEALLTQPQVVWEEVQALTAQSGLELTEALKREYLDPKKYLEAQKNRILAENLEREELMRVTEGILLQPEVNDGPHPDLLALQQQGDAALQNNTGTLTLLEPNQLKLASEALGRIEVNHSLFEHQEGIRPKEDPTKDLEKMGIDTQLTYEIYGQLYRENPEAVDTRNWMDWFENDPKKLATVIEKLIPPPNQPGAQFGRQPLIDAILSKSKDLPQDDPEIIRIQSKARDMVLKIKAIIDAQDDGLRVEMDALQTLEEAEKEGKLTLKGELKDFVGDLKRKLRTGDAIDKGLAGLTILGVVMLLKKAWGREGASGKMAFAGLLAAGGALWYESKTGKSAIEPFMPQKPGQETLRTHEGVLIQHGLSTMVEKGFKPKEFERAQFALRTIPFKKALEFYKEKSKPVAAQNQAKIDKLYQAMNIDDQKLIQEAKGKEKDKKTQELIYETVARNLEFVASEENISPEEVVVRLEETWVKAIEDKYFVARRAEITLPEESEAYFRAHPEELTMEKVMRTQVSPYLIKAQAGQPGSVETVATRAYEWASESAQALFSKVSNNEQVQALSDAAKRAKLYFEYEGGQLYAKFTENGEVAAVLGEAADGTWEILKTSVMFPVQVIGKGLELVPALADMVESLDEAIFPKKLVEVGPEFDLDAIAGKGAWQWNAEGRPQVDPETGQPVIAVNTEANPQYETLGEHQYGVWLALSEGPKNVPEAAEKGRLFHTQFPTGDQYLIVEVTPQTAGINKESPEFANRPERQKDAMKLHARQRALDFFKNETVETSELNEALKKPITGFEQTQPEAIFIAFHLPKKTS